MPTKTENNAGFDIYTTETDITLQPQEHRLFKTDLAVVPEEG